MNTNRSRDDKVLFEFVLKDALLFKRILEAISSIVFEANFRVSKNALELLAMGPARSTLIDFKMPSDAFDYFNAVDNELVFGVDTDELIELFKVKKETSLKFQLLPSRARLVFENGSSKRMVSQALIDLGGTAKRLKIDFDVKIEMSSMLWSDIINTAKLGNGEVVFMASKDELIVQTGMPSREIRHIVPIDSPEIMEYSFESPEDIVMSQYSYRKLRHFVKGVRVSSSCLIEFSTKKPLKVTFPVPGGGYLSYGLAPRMEID